MAKKKENKTNAMRILENKKIPYTHLEYECETFTDGIQVADLLGLPHEKVYKTLVTEGHGGSYFVFVIPVEAELDLKKAAKAVGQKAVSMLPVKEINQATGYIRGCCTAVGMKKPYPTVIDQSAQQLDTIIVSGGRIGSQIELSPAGLAEAAQATFQNIIQEGLPGTERT